MLTLEELNAHYKAVRARLDGPLPKKQVPASPVIFGTHSDSVVAAPKKEPEPIPAMMETPSKKIMSEVARKHEVPISVYKDHNRKMSFILCRQEAAYRLKTELGFSLSQIGRIFGNRDHTTIRHAVIQYTKKLAANNEVTASKCVSDACDTEAATQAQNNHA